MKLEKIGEGEAEYAVVGSIHGDEPCGKKTIERFLEANFDIKKPVKFIVANEEALEENQRYLNADLNRSFPGDSESEIHEERLATEIMDEIEGKKVLDIHSTRSYPEPFATLSELNNTTRELCKFAGVENVVYFPESNGTLNGQVEGIVLEAGYQGTEQAVENAYNVLLNFLAAEGIIEKDFEISEPSLFEYFETVEGDWTFTAENFQKVKKGEVFAYRNGEELEAEEDFYPVLMSTDGYEGQLGFKARKH